MTAVDDAVAEGPHTATIQHSAASADPNYNGIAVASVTAHITDNDTAGVVGDRVERQHRRDRRRRDDNYSVVLTTQPTADVTVTWCSGAPGHGEPDASSSSRRPTGTSRRT